MTIFDFDKEELGDWYSFFNSHIDPTTGDVIYDKPEEGAAEFRIRSMAPFWNERRKNLKKEYKMVLNPQTRAMERVGYYEDLPADEAQKENDDAWDYCITGMKNAFSSPGVEIECTRENKLKLINIPVFVRFISKVFSMQIESGVKQREASEKN